MTDKQIYQIGLTMINGVGDILARHLLEALGDAEAVFTEKRQSLEKISGIGDSIIAEIKRADVLLRAEKELAFAQKNGNPRPLGNGCCDWPSRGLHPPPFALDAFVTARFVSAMFRLSDVTSLL